MPNKPNGINEDNSKITIADVAAALGISKTTVSRAISGKGRIGEATRTKVLSYIEKYGYKPNPIAKGLAQQKTYNIGWVMPGDSSFSDLPFFQSCLRGIIDEAANDDYDVILSLIYDNDISGLKRLVNGNKVDGIILGRTLVNDESVKFLKSSGTPFVAIGSTDEEDVIQIDNDHINACKDLTIELAKSGVSSFALIVGSDNHVVNRSRKAGYDAGISKAGTLIKSSISYMNSDSKEAVDRIVEKSIQNSTQCIVCADDKICTLVMDSLRLLNVQVPRDIKVASFYDSDLLKSVRSDIKVIHYSPRQLGAKACRTLFEYLAGDEVPDKTLMGYEIL